MPPQIERLDALNRGMRLTSKLDGIDELEAEGVKYLKEASEIITGRAGDSSEPPPAERVASGSPPEGGKQVAPGKRSAARGFSRPSTQAPAGATE